MDVRHADFLRRRRSGLLAGLALALACAAGPAASEGAEVDPRLGAPLTQRERPELGSPDADVVILEVRSFACAQCRAFDEEVFPALRDRYITPGLARWVTIDVSDDPLDKSNPLFAIARCALREGRYEEAKPFLFANGRRSGSRVYSSLDAHPELRSLGACVRRGDTRPGVAADFDEAVALGVKVLPTFILRRRQPDGGFVEARVEGLPDESYFRRVLDRLREAD